MENNRSYFARRAAQERSAADKAGNPKARDAHEAMARHYDALAQTAAESEQLEPTPVQPAANA